MGSAGRPGSDGPRVLAVAAGAAQPGHLLRGRRPPDGAHRYRSRVSMTVEATRRFPIRYGLQRWSDGKWFYGSFFIILLVLVVINRMQHQQTVSFIPVLVLDGAILVAFWLMRSVSYVEITDDGLRIRYLLRHMELPYSSLARVRRQPLEVAFQPAERRRFVNRFVRRLAREPAAYIRLDRRQRDLVEAAERRPGPRLVAGADIVIPIVGVDEFIAQIKGRLRGQAS